MIVNVCICVQLCIVFIQLKILCVPQVFAQVHTYGAQVQTVQGHPLAECHKFYAVGDFTYHVGLFLRECGSLIVHAYHRVALYYVSAYVGVTLYCKCEC